MQTIVHMSISDQQENNTINTVNAPIKTGIQIMAEIYSLGRG